MSSKANQLLQKAGQSLHTATQALLAASQRYGAGVQTAMAESPFGMETDHLFEIWKATARLSQEANALDLRLREVYAQATATGSTSPISAMPLLASNATATDVEVKSATPTKRVTVAKKKKAKAAKAKVSKIPAKLPPNSEKLLAHLGKVLNTEEFVHINQSEAAQGAGIPKGSVTASLARLKAVNKVVEGDRGQFKLA